MQSYLIGDPVILEHVCLGLLKPVKFLLDLYVPLYNQHLLSFPLQLLTDERLLLILKP